MNRSIIYVWSTGYWIYGVDYHLGTHNKMGKYHEVIIGEGWDRNEVTRMVSSFVEENVLMWEDQ